MSDITRADLDHLQQTLTHEITQQVATLRIEWRQEMVTHIRWLAGLFVVQFVATVGTTAGVVGLLLKAAGKS